MKIFLLIFQKHIILPYVLMKACNQKTAQPLMTLLREIPSLDMATKGKLDHLKYRLALQAHFQQSLFFVWEYALSLDNNLLLNWRKYVRHVLTQAILLLHQ